MKEYMQSVNFKKTTLTLMASRIPEDQVKQLREAFEIFDTNGDGRLTLQELREGMKNVKGVKVTDEDVDLVMAAVDSNHNGAIDYSEFIAACLQSHNYLKENHLKSAFYFFDKDGNGTISMDELKTCLQNEDFTLADETIADIL
jgi:calcium-dependent protein kinase